MISAIFAALTVLPTFVKMCEDFHDWLGKEIAKHKVAAANKKALQFKDTSSIDDLFDPKD